MAGWDERMALKLGSFNERVFVFLESMFRPSSFNKNPVSERRHLIAWYASTLLRIEKIQFHGNDTIN
ncbi:MAG: hypothetical protein DWQ02_18405 [Bacteroidetes bacterium]|nr:MAG: hypothetical protein DWQ02_18405 [Bacteroidota bacterium]